MKLRLLFGNNGNEKLKNWAVMRHDFPDNLILILILIFKTVSVFKTLIFY